MLISKGSAVRPDKPHVRGSNEPFSQELMTMSMDEAPVVRLADWTVGVKNGIVSVASVTTVSVTTGDAVEEARGTVWVAPAVGDSDFSFHRFHTIQPASPT